MAPAHPPTHDSSEAGRRGPGQRRRSGRGRAPHRSQPDQRRVQAQQARRAALESITIDYPDDLPVAQVRDEIAAAIRDHQVVIVAGETGSGKTTQLPKICLELGRGIDGMIGHTQPRRIAARSVAERVSEELGVELGDAVGYQVRFTDRSQSGTALKVMTDGILLSELSRDRDLRRYDTLIIDEAHERSLTIDFLLGYLRALLSRRPDLKVIITSATIDVQRFAEHFTDDQGHPAPVVEVSGRSYPVEIRYRPLTRPGPPAPDGTRTLVDIDQISGVCDAVEELWTEDPATGPADILVFCSGEREIRDTTDALTGLNLPQTEVLPLFGRLSAAEQHRIFASHRGRRIVVSTNVAETSLTVPGIRYVVDTGTARISRYSQRLKVQRLPIEPVSQASANQRSGRCGRLAPGIAIRLYSQQDFEERPEFTDPEILRTNLASVILQMAALRLGEIADFPFIDPPDERQIADGVRLLSELKALRSDSDIAQQPGRDSEPTPRRGRPRRGPQLTPEGRTLARLPLDPRLARMVLEADRLGARDDVLIIAAALSIQDPRERPAEKQTQADQAHARFREGADDSDFLVLLNLWRYLREQQRELSGSAFRRMCAREFLHYLRVREWQDLHAQLRRACRDVGLDSTAAEPSAEAIHQSILTGLLSHVGMWDQSKREYLGARGARFAVQPGSVLFRSRPDWIMSAELVETTRLWARVNAVVDPAWVERAAEHLVRRSYAEPRWSRSRASAVADERVSLYGIPLVAGRPVPYGRIDPEVSRDLFIRHALVEGDWDTGHEFFRENRALIARLGDLEARARRRDLVVEDETLVAFYDQRIGEEVVSGAHFDNWWKKERRIHPDLLTFTEDLLLRDAGQATSETDYPGTWRQADLELRLSYQFSPGSTRDGVTCHIPLEVVNQVSDSGFDALVPGFRIDLVTAMIRALPKEIRRGLVPAGDSAREVCATLAEGGFIEPHTGTTSEVSMVQAVADALQERAHRAGVRVSAADIDLTAIPDHLRMTFSIERRERSRRGRSRVEVVAEGKNLEALRDQVRPQVRTTMAAAAAELERSGLRAWPADLTELPAVFEQRVGSRRVQGFPALVDKGAAVDLQVLPTARAAGAATRRGLRRLVLLGIEPPWNRLLALLDNQDKLTLAQGPHASVPELLDDALAAAVDQVLQTHGGPAAAGARPAAGAGGTVTVRTPEDFAAALAATRTRVVPLLLQIIEHIVPVIRTRARILQMLQAATSVRGAGADIAAQEQRHLDELIGPGFIATAGMERLPHLNRYLLAIVERLEKGAQNPDRDEIRSQEVYALHDEIIEFTAGLDPDQRWDSEVLDLPWQLEELRVSLFAQRLGTAAPVSTKRIRERMDRIHARLRS